MCFLEVLPLAASENPSCHICPSPLSKSKINIFSLIPFMQYCWGICAYLSLCVIQVLPFSLVKTLVYHRYNNASLVSSGERQVKRLNRCLRSKFNSILLSNTMKCQNKMNITYDMQIIKFSNIHKFHRNDAQITDLICPLKVIP